MSLLRRAARNLRADQRGAPGWLPWGDSTPPSNGQLAVTAAGTSVSEKSVIGLAPVWACVRVLSDAVATLPLNQFKGYGQDKKRIDPSPVIADPWPACTPLEWRSQGTVSMSLRGNFFGLVTDRDRNMTASQIQPLSPSQVRVQPAYEGGLEWRVDGVVTDVDDIFHVPYLLMPGTPLGLNPIEVMRNTFGMASATDLHAGAFFANSANPSGTLNVPGDLSEEETLELARAWTQSHQGIGAAHLPAVLTAGTTWQQMTINPEDAQLLESREYSASEIAMIFGIPPHMIGQVDRSTSWGQGIEQQELGFVRVTLGGYLRRWEERLSALLPPGQYVRFDMKARLRGDTLQRFNAWNLAHMGGFMTANQICDEEDLPHLPGDAGDVYLQPLNIGAAGASAPPEPPSGAQSSEDKGAGGANPLIRMGQDLLDQRRLEQLAAAIERNRREG